MVIRSARGPFDCFHFSNLTLEVVVYHKLYHISRHARPSCQHAAGSRERVSGLQRSAAGRPGSVGSDFSVFRVQIEGQTRAARGSAARRPVRIHPPRPSPQSGMCRVRIPHTASLCASHGDRAIL